MRSLLSQVLPAAGKSTLVSALLGFHAPINGVIKINGTDVRDIDTRFWRAQTAAVLQSDRLEQAMTVRGQLFPDGEVDLADIWQILKDVQLDTEVAAMPMATQSIVDDYRLSMGQRQRMLLARALVRTPRLIFLDEALSAVPESMKTDLIAMIRSKGMTAVIVSHDEYLIKLTDRVLLLANGGLAFDGPPEIAVEQSVFKDIFAAEHRNE